MPICAKCREVKTAVEMVKNRSTSSGLGSYCLPCNRAAYKAWRQANVEKARELTRASCRQWRESDPERARVKGRETYNRNRERIRDRQVGVRLKSRYGITLEDYEALLAKQNGVCAICEQPCKTGERLSVDHNHATGVVRGLLCRGCNFRLGQIEKPGLEKFLEYLA